ncbi:MAG: TlpA disulfide reductase family protein [Chlamydiota bacterium]|nr:TlpA disulfide reductase family protein [Chlamydiota bacterium]
MSNLVKNISRLYHFSLPVIVIILGIQITIITVQNRRLKDELVTKWSNSAGIQSIKLTPPETLKPGTKLAAVTLKDTLGAEVNMLPANANKNTLLLVFSTTCPACKQNKPIWKELVESMDKNEWDIYGLSTTDDEKTKEFVAQNDLPYQVLGIQKEKELKQELKISRVPTTIVVDKDQKVIASWIGVLTPSREEVEKTLGIKK